MIYHVVSKNAHALVWAKSRQQALYAYRDATNERDPYRIGEAFSDHFDGLEQIPSQDNPIPFITWMATTE